MLEEAGLDADPQAIRDWETLRTYARKLTVKKDGKVVRAGMQMMQTNEPPIYHLANWVYANGGSFYSKDYKKLALDSSQAVEALEFIKSMMDEGFQAPPSNENPIATGAAAMIVGGTWMGAEIEKARPGIRLGMTSMPMGPSGTKRGATLWANMMVIPKGAKNVEAAWEYLKYYTGLEGQTDLLKVWARPGAPRLDVYRTNPWRDTVKKHPYLAEIPNIFQVAGPYMFIRSNDLGTAMNNHLWKALRGQTSAKAALELAVQAGNRVLK